MSACLALEQTRVVTFKKIFDPSFTREKSARGYASIVKAFIIKGYEDYKIQRLHEFAVKASHKKTVARALELIDDPFITKVAQEMADKGFRLRESKHEVII
jgi:hypothetical protein